MLNLTAVYALRAMTFLASSGTDPVPARTISQRMRIPRNYLSKIMHRLGQEGYVVSGRGLNGGFRLRKRPGSVSLYDVASLFMNFDNIGPCFLGLTKEGCTCRLNKKWAPIADRFMKLLKETTIDQVL